MLFNLDNLIFLLTFLLYFEKAKSQSNVVVIVVDDLGIGDLGCFGNTTVKTPNIDALCQDGAKLTHHVTSAVLCTPSRAALLTGRYGIRMGMTGLEDTPPVLIYAAGRAGLPANETSFARVAKDNGYRTAAVGKWHLGLNELQWGDQVHGPLGHGFDYFFGLPHTLVDGFELEDEFWTLKECFNEMELPMILFCLIPLRYIVGRKTYFTLIFLIMSLSWFMLEHFRVTRSNWWQRSPTMEKFCNSFLLENNEVVEKPINLQKLSANLVDKSVEIIGAVKTDPRPFLLYHSFAHVHTPLATGDQFDATSPGHGKYGDVLAEMDHGVGRIVQAIKDAGLEDDTLVYLTSDHGGDQPQLGDQGGFNGVFRGGKGNGALEGGMRVPGIIKWPRVVKAGVEINAMTSLLDILPTVASVITNEEDDSKNTFGDKLDGVSMLSLLKNQSNLVEKKDRLVYHFCDSEIFAMRTQVDGVVYKLILREPLLSSSGSCQGDMCPCYGPDIRVHLPPLLYKIDLDPTESYPLNYDSDEYKVVYNIMRDGYLHFKEDLDKSKMPSQYSSMLKILPIPWLQPVFTKSF